MKRFWLAATMTAGVALMRPAAAADLPSMNDLPPLPAMWSWAGFYAGINGGYLWGRASWDGLSSFDTTGYQFGGTLGYNYQFAAFVLGLETDFGWSHLTGSAACPTFSCDVSTSWLGTVRARLGYGYGRFLPYITGGGAYGDVTATDNNPGFSTVTTTRVGWTLGAGVEYAFWHTLTAKLEYLYVDLGHFDCGTACAPVPTNVGVSANVLRLGVNYRF